ncbi:AAA family ATPase [Mycobacteroides abscessus]|uniref:AAA family ATPase n=1 Tax=Mycobacteroides abscessus TaxID=36809 RepID=UPI0018967A83
MTAPFHFGDWVAGTNKPQPPAAAAAPDIDFGAGTQVDPYTRAAIENECAAVAAAPEGQRNHQLNTSAFNLKSLIDAGRAGRQHVTDLLTQAARACGLDKSEILPTIESGFRGSAAKVGARQVPELEDVAPAFTIDPDQLNGTDDNGQPTEAALAARDYLASAIQQRAFQLRVDREARRLIEEETRPQISYPAVRSLDALLAQPLPPVRFRIDQLAPVDARVMLSAAYKAGKSTLVGNVMRSLADGGPFLGRFTVNTPAKRIVLIDDELSDHTVQRWLQEQRIANTAAVADVVTLRGNVKAFNLLDDNCRARWATRLGDIGCDYLILDCLRPVMDAIGLDENREAGRFLVPFDELLKDAGIGDALLVHHMGHNGERSRGDSRLQDWPDAIWRLMRETDEPSSPRFFSAYGRDVDIPEGRLAFDPSTRHLTYAEGSRGDAKTADAMTAIIDVLAGIAKSGGEGLSGRAIEGAVDGEHSRGAVRAGLQLAIKQGVVLVEQGPRNAKVHRIAKPCRGCGMPVAAGGDVHQSCVLGVVA